MKKLILFIFIGLIVFISLPIVGTSNQKMDESDYEVIPDDAIRLRILANSDSEKDQALKRLVRDKVNAEINKWVEELTDIQKARDIIEENIPVLDAIVEDVLEEQGADSTFTIDYQDKVTFPTKMYGSYIYPAGEYEAVLITLGEGAGENWWCVLFPPLCFLDFSNGTTVQEEVEEEESNQKVASKDAEDAEEVEVTFFLFEWFGWS